MFIVCHWLTFPQVSNAATQTPEHQVSPIDRIMRRGLPSDEKLALAALLTPRSKAVAIRSPARAFATGNLDPISGPPYLLL
jgi:hypothetical protein